MTMKNYNAKAKLQSTSKTTVISTKAIPGGQEANLKSEITDAKDKPQSTSNFTLKCENNIIYMDMRHFMPEEQLKGFENMEMKVNGDFLELPDNISPGQTLKDGKMEMEMSNQGMKMMTMKVNITNRKVEATESKTTPAGTFECMCTLKTVFISIS